MSLVSRVFSDTSRRLAINEFFFFSVSVLVLSGAASSNSNGSSRKCLVTGIFRTCDCLAPDVAILLLQDGDNCASSSPSSVVGSAKTSSFFIFAIHVASTTGGVGGGSFLHFKSITFAILDLFLSSLMSIGLLTACGLTNMDDELGNGGGGSLRGRGGGTGGIFWRCSLRGSIAGGVSG
jgi:hypothetical protein